MPGPHKSLNKWAMSEVMYGTRKTVQCRATDEPCVVLMEVY